MSLVTEDGTGKPDAESYCSVEAATDYHGKRGSGDAWDLIDDQEAALRKATDYITQVCGGNWLGVRWKAEQALDWPRQSVAWKENPMQGFRPLAPLPTELVNACAELALRTKDGDLMTDEGRETVSESVGEISVSYRPGSSRQTRRPAIEGWLRTLLREGFFGSAKISRS